MSRVLCAPLQAELERACRGGAGFAGQGFTPARLSSSRGKSAALAGALCAAWPPFLALPLWLLPEAGMRPAHAAFFAYCTLGVMALKLLWWRMLGALEQAADLLVTSLQRARLQVRGGWPTGGTLCALSERALSPVRNPELQLDFQMIPCPNSDLGLVFRERLVSWFS